MIGRSRGYWMVGFVTATLLATAAACNLPDPVTQGSSGIPPLASVPATSAPAATGLPDLNRETPTAILHKTSPADPPAAFVSQIRTSIRPLSPASTGRREAENFNLDFFERPFDQSMNTYYPDLDIRSAAFSRDASWDYGTINLVGQDPKGGLTEEYAVEIDVNRDGRGDFLIVVLAPEVGWSTNGVQIWEDRDHDVGGLHPILSDPPPQTGDGYETLLFNQGQSPDPDMAWGRVSPLSYSSVQIAFKRTLFDDAHGFLWGAWAIDPVMFHPDWFDYNDHFTQAEAGSPLVELTQYYPLKALYGIDNTCRWAVGFTPTGNEPDICPVPPTPTPTPLPIPTPTPALMIVKKLIP